MVLLQSHLKLSYLIHTEYNLLGLQWVNGGYLLNTTLGTDSHITLTENMNGLNSPFIGVTSFIPLPPISETEGDAYLTIKSLISTMNDPLKLEDPVTKLTLKISHQFLIKLNTLPTPLKRTTLIDCHNVFSGELNFCKRVKNIISIQ